MTGTAVLIVDDEADLRAALGQTLELAGVPAREAPEAGAAMALLAAADGGDVGAVLCDVKMPGRDGFSLLEAVRRADPDLPVVMLTGHGDVPMAVAAMRAGAYDFLEKPAPGRRLVDVLTRALEKRRLVLENRRLRASLNESDAGLARPILGASPAMGRFRALLDKVAASDVDLLIYGETGSGKELTARAVHDLSARRDGRFVAVNCGALPTTLAESELFGHEPGAFTGATKRRVGKFVYADGGTLFLDEIESMPLGLQVALLRVLQEREVEPLGANRAHPVDMRVVAATKVDLRALADAGRFREDLLYRLDVARLDLPPLRARLEDAPPLFEAFVAQAAARAGLAPPEISDAVRAWILAQPWPGNVRELKNMAERYVIGVPVGPESAGEKAGEKAGGSSDGVGASLGSSLAERLAIVERRLIAETLSACDGRVVEAAARLGLPRNTLYDRMKKFGLGSSGAR